MNAAVITIVMFVVLFVIIAVLLWVIADQNAYRRELEDRRELEAIRRSHQLAAEQSRAHARADERQWADDVPARIWRNK